MNITTEQLVKIAGKKLKATEDVAKYVSEFADKYEVNTPLRMAHFISQAAHESGGFFYAEELWGPTPAQARYDTRTDLGNTPEKDGDGYLYRGRGIFQLTGKANYEQMSKILGVDLVKTPNLASSPKISVLVALEYWKTRKLNAVADTDDVKKVTKIINGGSNGLADRTRLLAIAKDVLGVTKSKPTPAPVAPKPVETKTPDTLSIQKALNKNGMRVTVDGKSGPQTTLAIKTFQKFNGLTPDGVVGPATSKILFA